jgi:hypothetical protein
VTIEGEKKGIGSAQLFVKDAPDASDVDTKNIRSERIERLRVFDYLLGTHIDRKDGKNWLVQSRGEEQIPVAIDHGLAFPTRINTWPDPRYVRKELPPPQIEDESTRKLILRASSARVAQVLSNAGLGDIAIKRTVLRLEILREANGGPAAASDPRIDTWVVATRAQ